MSTTAVIVTMLAWKGLWVFIGWQIGQRKNRRGWLYGLIGNWMGVAILAGRPALGSRSDAAVAAWHQANPVPKPHVSTMDGR